MLLFHGFVLSQLEQNDEAEGCLCQALKLEPNNEETHFNLGRVYEAKGKFHNAEKHLKRAIEIDPKYALAYAELGKFIGKG